jgi:glucosamine-6-phosphate deaminase
MRLEILETAQAACSAAADYISENFPQHGVLGVATGNTQLALYQELAKRAPLSVKKAFALDEYIGLSRDDPRSFHSYLVKLVEEPLGFAAGTVRVPLGIAIDLDKEAAAFESEILKEPVDLQILGVGTNGHVAFNEPGSDPESKTRVVLLSQETRIANKADFGDLAPEAAISQGIGTILRAKKLVLIATGASKAHALSMLLARVENPEYPVTYLASHPDLVVFADKAAAN